jgi:threonine dehydrogenase-like Zn-dependent dehydrogenase
MNLAPARSLHKISRDVPPEHAALAEPLSCVWHAFGKAKPTPGETVAIIGGGPIGILFAMLFKAAGAGLVLLSEKVEFRRKLAADCGADCVIDPAAQDPVEAVRANTGRGADIVVDAAGASFPEALKMVRGAGRVILFGMIQQSDCTVNQYSMVRNEVTVHGSFIQRTAFPEAVRLLESGKLPIAKLVTHQFGLGEFGTAVDLLRRGQSLKAVLRPAS